MTRPKCALRGCPNILPPEPPRRARTRLYCSVKCRIEAHYRRQRRIAKNRPAAMPQEPERRNGPPCDDPKCFCHRPDAGAIWWRQAVKFENGRVRV